MMIFVQLIKSIYMMLVGAPRSTCSQFANGDKIVHLMLANKSRYEINHLWNGLSLTSTTTIGITVQQIPIHSVSGLTTALANKTCQLHTLDMKLNQLGPREAQSFADALSSNTQLHTLNLQWNLIGDAGVKSLAQGLKTNTNLRALNLSHNNITSKGCLYLADALKVNCTLQKLKLYWNKIGNDGACSLLQALKFSGSALHHIDLQVNHMDQTQLDAFNGKFDRIKYQRALCIIRTNRLWKHIPPELYCMLLNVLVK